MSRFDPRSFLPPPTRSIPGQYGACNGLRGLGALAIVFAHLVLVTDFNFFPHVEYIAAVVDLFFLFSGFVMAHAYEAKLSAKDSVGEFLIRRFGRIWPLHAATLLLLIVWELVRYTLSARGMANLQSVPFSSGSLNAADAILPNLLFLNAVGLTQHETWNFPSWSLGAEFCAYLIFAGLFVFKIKHRRVAAGLIVTVALLVLLFLAPNGMRSTYDFGAARCVASFFLGMLLQNLTASGRLPKWPLPTLVECITCACAFVLVALCAETKAAILIPFILGGLLLIIAAERGRISDFLMTRPVQVLAEWSYSIYMVHALVMLAILSFLHICERRFGVALFVPNPGADSSNVSAELIHLGHNRLAEIAFMMAYMAAVIMLSAVTYWFIEVPGRNMFNRLAKRYSPVKLAPAKAKVPVES